MVTVRCAECGREYQTQPAWLRRVKSPTCSRRCNGKARGRDWAKHGYKGTTARKTIPRLTGPLNPAWKGGVTIKRAKGNYRGVRYVRCPMEWMAMARADGCIMEHRLVMARWVGRLLTRTEVVHHVNHDPSDNRRANLELWPTNADHRRGEVGRFVDGVANRVSLLGSERR